MEQTGILLIAHGSKNQQWVEYIEQTIAAVNIDLPMTIGFLERVEGRSIADGVRELEKRKIKRIIAIPLFISSGSTHLEEIKFALGVIPTSRIETDFRPIDSHAEIIWCSAMDDHPYIINILKERIQLLSKEPANEGLLLVAHGSDKEGFYHLWEDTLQNISRSLKNQFSFQEVRYATVHPNNIMEQAKTIGRNKKLLIVPVFLSEGYYTSRYIPSKLEGLEYLYSGETYLPHPLVSKWIENSINHVEGSICACIYR